MSRIGTILCGRKWMIKGQSFHVSQELAEIEKLEHSFRQVLAYDETFKEIFKGWGGANEHNPIGGS